MNLNSFLCKTASLFLHFPPPEFEKNYLFNPIFCRYIIWVPNILDLSSGSVFYEASTETKLQRSSIVLKLICKRKKKKRVNSKNISIPIDVSMSIALTTMRSNLTQYLMQIYYNLITQYMLSRISTTYGFNIVFFFEFWAPDKDRFIFIFFIYNYNAHFPTKYYVRPPARIVSSRQLQQLAKHRMR